MRTAIQNTCAALSIVVFVASVWITLAAYSQGGG